VHVPAGEEKAAEQHLRLRPLEPGRALGAVEHAAALVELGALLGEVRRDDAVAERLPSSAVRSVVLPEPFGPTSPTCSPRSIANVTLGSSTRSATRTSSPSTDTTVRPERGGLRNSKPSDFERVVSAWNSPAAPERSFSSRAICESFACACFALLFL
jgi:hypothetical protein